MTRPNAQLKMEYYPTPPRVVQLIAAHVAHPLQVGTRLLDPCAGKGEALAQFASLLGDTETYGVELNADRAQESKARLTRALACSYNELRAPANACQLLFLNPPYDWENGKREEWAGRLWEKGSRTPVWSPLISVVFSLGCAGWIVKADEERWPEIIRKIAQER